MLNDIATENFDDERFAEIEAKGAAESEKRIDAVDRGELQTVDGPSALRELRSLLEKMTAGEKPLAGSTGEADSAVYRSVSPGPEEFSSDEESLA